MSVLTGGGLLRGTWRCYVATSVPLPPYRRLMPCPSACTLWDPRARAWEGTRCFAPWLRAYQLALRVSRVGWEAPVAL